MGTVMPSLVFWNTLAITLRDMEPLVELYCRVGLESALLLCGLVNRRWLGIMWARTTSWSIRPTCKYWGKKIFYSNFFYNVKTLKAESTGMKKVDFPKPFNSGKLLIPRLLTLSAKVLMEKFPILENKCMVSHKTFSLPKSIVFF